MKELTEFNIQTDNLETWLSRKLLPSISAFLSRYPELGTDLCVLRLYLVRFPHPSRSINSTTLYSITHQAPRFLDAKGTYSSERREREKKNKIKKKKVLWYEGTGARHTFVIIKQQRLVPKFTNGASLKLNLFQNFQSDLSRKTTIACEPVTIFSADRCSSQMSTNVARRFRFLQLIKPRENRALFSARCADARVAHRLGTPCVSVKILATLSLGWLSGPAARSFCFSFDAFSSNRQSHWHFFTFVSIPSNFPFCHYLVIARLRSKHAHNILYTEMISHLT